MIYWGKRKGEKGMRARGLMFSVCVAAAFCAGCASRQTDTAGQTIVLERVARMEYADTGLPYFHDTLKNNTEKTVTAVETAMLAYDTEGLPLELYWDFMDSDDEPKYGYLRHEDMELPPGGTKDADGGWTLYDGEKIEDWPVCGDGGANKAEYGLFCVKRVEFDDGTVWENPDYAGWREEYQGKAQDVASLQEYYPKEYCIFPAE